MWVGKGFQDWNGVGPDLQTAVNAFTKVSNASVGTLFALSGYHIRNLLKGAVATGIGNSIGDVARGKAGREKSGRPVEYSFAPEQWEIIEGIWTSRKYANDGARLAAIEKRLGKVPGRTLLRNKLGSPHKGRE